MDRQTRGLGGLEDQMLIYELLVLPDAGSLCSAMEAFARRLSRSHAWLRGQVPLCASRPCQPAPWESTRVKLACRVWKGQLSIGGEET